MGGDEELEGLEAVRERAEPRFLVISLLQSLVQLSDDLARGGNDVGSEAGLAAAVSVLGDRLGLAGVGLFSIREGSRLASVGMPMALDDLLYDGGDAGDSLITRVLRDERIFLIGRHSAEPCLSRLRQLGTDWQVLALVPLRTGVGVQAVLVLGAHDATVLAPELLGSLHPVFRFLALSFGLFPGMPGSAVFGGQGEKEGLEGPADTDDAMPSVEDLEAELEALRSRNREMEDLLQTAQEASAAGEAARRVEIEGARMQIAQLESSLAGVGGIEDLKDAADEAPCETCLDLQQVAEQAENSVRSLQDEIEQLKFAADVAASVVHVDLDDPGLVAARATDSLEAGSLGAMADAVVAELVGEESGEGLGEGTGMEAGAAEVAPPIEQKMSAASPVSVFPLESELDPESERELALEPEPAREPGASGGSAEPWVLCAAAGSGTMFDELADFAGAHDLEMVSLETDTVPEGRRLVLTNLLLDDPDEIIASMGESRKEDRLLGYIADGGQGAPLGEIGWLSAHLTTEEALERLGGGHGLPRHTLLVSERLREMAGLREALTNAGSAVAMACDARQALDLLEIVQKPDAAILDVAVESAAALALGARLVQENGGGNFQLFFLAPESGDKATLSPDPAFAEVFRPFGVSDLQSLIAPWIRLHQQGFGGL